MAKIKVKLRDGQNLGYIQMRNNEPYYGYDKISATDFTEKEAVKLCGKLHSKYCFDIEVDTKEVINQRIKIIYKS